MSDNWIVETIMALRGGPPEKCDFCDQPYTDERWPTPEEAGEFACIECVRRWEKEDAENAAADKSSEQP